jgi:hypothetical protein
VLRTLADAGFAVGRARFANIVLASATAAASKAKHKVTAKLFGCLLLGSSATLTYWSFFEKDMPVDKGQQSISAIFVSSFVLSAVQATLPGTALVRSTLRCARLGSQFRAISLCTSDHCHCSICSCASQPTHATRAGIYRIAHGNAFLGHSDHW